MEELKIRGLVIREDAMGEKDKRLVLLTAEQGRLSVLAKGALTAKSRFRAVCGLFCYADYVLTKGKTFYYVKEAVPVESFYALRTGLEKVSCATLMTEVAEVLVPEGEENHEMMQLLLRGLWAMGKAEEGTEYSLLCAYLFRALADNGFYPNLNECPSCGGSFDTGEKQPARFLFQNGTVYCTDCARISRGGVYHDEDAAEISRGTLNALRYFVSAPYEKLFSFRVSKEVEAELMQVATGYLLTQTEHRYRGLDFLVKVQKS